MHFGSHTFVPISWMCKKQTSVSHSSTGAEIISLDAGLRMDGIPALDLWNLFFEVLHFNQNQPSRAGGPESLCQWLFQRLRGRRGFTRQPENSKRAHSRVPALQTPPKFPREDTQRDRKSENGAGVGKKREMLGPPPFGAPPFGAHLLGPHASGPDFFWVWAPPFGPLPSGPPRSRP